MQSTKYLDVFIDGNYLVINNDDRNPIQLPPKCLRCNSEHKLAQRKINVIYIPIWTGLLVFMGVLPFVLFYLLFRKEVRLNACLCPTHLREFKLKEQIPLYGILLGVVLGVSGALTGNYGNVGLVIAGMSLFALSGLAYLYIKPIKFKRFKKGLFWIKGVSPDFINNLETVETSQRKAVVLQ